MSLFEDMMVDCVRLDMLRSPDGEGGYEVMWAEGEPFRAAIHRDSTIAARVAEKAGMRDVYTVTVPRGLDLAFHDVFRRVSDGKAFRVTASTEDRKTPGMATFAFARVSAQEWEPEE